ncbi:MAG: permease prefix domain 1-containing protein [Candidatus Sulfotelmatobacter sp.]
MRFWRQEVGERLESCSLPAGHREEIVSELASHLEEAYEAARRQGLNEADAVHRALQEAGDWNVLGKDIGRAMRAKEQTMNQRTRSLWLPGLASFATASLFLLVLTRISMEPRVLVRLESGLGRSFYVGWLLAQVLFGALGAFLSRRAGGTRSARIVASAFPAIVMFGLWAFVIPVSAVLEHNAFVLRHPLYYSLGILVWVVAPAVTLLLGAAPFLKEPKVHEA